MLILVAIAVLGMGFYVIRYFVFGSVWVAAPFNSTVFRDGVLISGRITDRGGVVLAEITDGKRTFAESGEVRRSSLHVVGDREGNIGTGALRVYASEMMGFNPVTGAFSLTGNAGRTISLTVDTRLQTEALRAINGRQGVVLVSNYVTGEILCMVSSPTFDPNTPPVVVDDEEGVYINRAIQAAYTPGSTFKLITAAAAIENIYDIYSREFLCTGGFVAGADTVTCHGTHGTLGFEEGMRISCNVVYGQLAIELGADILARYAGMYGLSGRTTIGDMITANGNFDKAPPNTADLAWSGVGQYTNMVCPATMLRFVSAIANDGDAMDLFLLRKSGISAVLPASSSRLMPNSTARELRGIIKGHNQQGFPGLEIHAKSGTAQLGGDLLPHAWYVGFITNPGHPYAFVVIIENGGGGTANAAPVANRVLQVAVK